MNEVLTEFKDSDEDQGIRPLEIKDFTGQSDTIENLSTFIRGAIRRNEPLDHILFYGPPGLGKTTLSRIISRELGVGFKTIAAPAISKPGELASILVSLSPLDVLFIDEIHRLPQSVEEMLYSAMEDYKLSILVGNDTSMEPIEVDLNPFTLVAATTRKGMISQPLNDRFGIQFRMDYYNETELSKIVQRAAFLLNIKLSEESITEISKRSRGTPRISLRLLRRIRDFIEDKHDPKHFVADYQFTNGILDKLGVSSEGLDELDQRYLSCLINTFKGGPVGVETLAASLSESRDTLESSVEPYLLRKGYIVRTPRGRKVSDDHSDGQLQLI